MSNFDYTDKDGDRLHAARVTTNPPFVAYLQVADTEYDSSAAVGLTADAARDLAAKLTEWAGEEEPPAPTFAVGDRVEVVNGGGGWNGPATVADVWDESSAAGGAIYGVLPDSPPRRVGAFRPEHVRRLLTPDYAALAATFKPGDLAIVGDNPDIVAVGVEPVHGCDDDFAGKGVNVIAKDEDDASWLEALYGDEPTPVFAELVRVSLDDGFSNYIHVAHLTRVEAVKW